MQPGDKLTIETPEQTTLEFPLAGIGSRSLALAIDTLLQIAAAIVLATIGAIIAYADSFPKLGKQWTYAILIFFGFLVEFGYFAFFEIVWNGQTPGKRWNHLRVITDAGRPIDAQAAILRNLVRIVDSLPTLYAVGIITSLISPQNKRLGDYLAGTVVVFEKAIQGDAVWHVSTTPYQTMAQPFDLSVAQLELIETFLDRRNSFPEDVRASMARQIAERISRRSSVPPEALVAAEKFLENLAEQSRNRSRSRS